MSRPLHRALFGNSGVRFSGGGGDSIDHDNGLGSSQNQLQSLSTVGSCRSRATVAVALLFLKLSLGVIVALAVSGSLYWTISMSTSSQVNIHQGYRKLQEQLITDLFKIRDLSLGGGMVESKDVELCPPEYEDYVPCYYNNTTEEYERRCVQDDGDNKKKNCLVLPPRNYRIPLGWPTGKDFIWKENVKITGHEFSSGSLTKRMMVEEEQISFHSDSLMVDGVQDYSHQIAEMIGLKESDFNLAGIRNVLDIGCGFGSFGAYLFSKQLLTTCIANYEESGSQVQITLERGLPAIIASFASRQLPFPHLSFDMLHCGRCGIDWDAKGGIFLVEVDRLLKPGGYFVWTNKQSSLRINKEDNNKLETVVKFADDLCWHMLSQQDETVVWKKPSNSDCYDSRKSGPEICGKKKKNEKDMETPYYQPLQWCIAGTQSRRWVPIENTTPWPSRAKPNSSELINLYGLHMEDFLEDAVNWDSVVKNYWSLLSPLIFSDHPKRPGDEEPPPPLNMLRNVLDMDAGYGGFNSALLDAGKGVWVMNVVPTTGPNHLPLILDRGFVGVQHDWCEAFPTYPRTYDLVHGNGILTDHQTGRCSMLGMLMEVDRILRPQGWVILRDKTGLIEAARYAVTAQLRWEARLIVPDVKSDERLLICQKPFVVNK